MLLLLYLLFVGISCPHNVCRVYHDIHKYVLEDLVNANDPVSACPVSCEGEMQSGRVGTRVSEPHTHEKRAVIFKSRRLVTHNTARDFAAPQTCCIPLLIPQSTITSWNSSKPGRRSQGTSCCPAEALPARSGSVAMAKSKHLLWPLGSVLKQTSSAWHVAPDYIKQDEISRWMFSRRFQNKEN